MPISDKNKAMTIKSAFSSYVIFSLIWGIPTLIWIIPYFKTGMFHWEVVAICLTGLAVSILWLASFKITLNKDEITYRSMFGGTVSLSLKEIKKAEILTGCFTFADRFKPTSRLVLEPFPSSKRKAIVINIKVFRQKNLSSFFSELDKELRLHGAVGFKK